MPDLPSITDTLGWVMYKRGDYNAAIPLFQERAQKTPDSAQYHYHLGAALIASGKKVKGIEQLQAALRLKLSESDALQARELIAR